MSVSWIETPQDEPSPRGAVATEESANPVARGPQAMWQSWIGILALWALGLSACSQARLTRDVESGRPQTAGYDLVHAETTIRDAWLHMPLRGSTDYRLAVFEDRVAIRAVGRNSASGLIRRVEFVAC